MSRTSKANHRARRPGRRAGVSAVAPLSERAFLPGSGTAVASICIGLVAVVWAVFGQTIHFKFLTYDDNKYVFDNAHVRAGISPANIVWAFTHLDIHLWSPVTALSHMLDCQVFQLAAGGHHLTNVLLHAATAVLLFLLFREMTGATWRSAFVAALFAIHPLRVESVAWIAERKDMLDGLFFALTLAAYLRYAQGKASASRYLPVMLFLALGLMAKPMLATMPFLLLLLDYWPLGRIRELHAAPASESKPRYRVDGLGRLALEKAPLLLLAGACIAVTSIGSNYIDVHKSGQPSEPPPPLVERLGNGVAASLIYIRQMVWPSDAGVIESSPHPVLTPGLLMLAVLLILAVSVVAVLFGKRFPYLPVGWFWYMGMLVPVSGFAPLGLETRADRYTYLPQIGLYLLLTWLVVELLPTGRRSRVALGAVAAVFLALMGWIAHERTAYWRDTLTLWTETLAHTTDNLAAEENMGAALQEVGRYDEGIAHYLKAMAMKPDSGVIQECIGSAYYQQGRMDKALEAFQKAVSLAPASFTAHDNLGLAMIQLGRTDEGIAEYRKALSIFPYDAYAHQYLAAALSQTGRLDEAIAEYRKAIWLIPDDARTHTSLGVVLIQKGELAEAAEQFEEAVRLNPQDADALNNLATMLASAPVDSIRNGPRAVELAREAVQITRGADPLVLSTLAAAYAESGRFAEAIDTSQLALRSANVQSDPRLLEILRSRLALFESHLPFHDENMGKAAGAN